MVRRRVSRPTSLGGGREIILEKVRWTDSPKPRLLPYQKRYYVWFCREQAMHNSTIIDSSQEYRLQYWATRLSICSFARTPYLFAYSALLASLARTAALTCSLAHSLTHSLACVTVNDYMAIFPLFFLFWTIVDGDW